MERLTERYVPNDEKNGISGIKVFESKNKTPLVKVLSGEYLYPAIEKLATYEDLEEQGLLVRLPVATGTNVYVVGSFLDCIYDYEHCEATQKWKCEEYVQCEYEKKKYYVKEIKFTSIMKNSIGKSIFLTREEAEKKLEEIQNDKA